ncbi:MAG TPA: hypothetical protein VGI92_00635 [Gemmatimonadales bacterium]|jgi:vancomycin permeability regulator SanA
MQIQIAPSFLLKSPGQVYGSLYMFDDDGLQSLTMRIHTADSTFKADSFLFLTGDNSITRPFDWAIPSGIGVGAKITFYAKAVDFTNFATADSVTFTVQSSAGSLH